MFTFLSVISSFTLSRGVTFLSHSISFPPLISFSFKVDDKSSREGEKLRCCSFTRFLESILEKDMSFFSLSHLLLKMIPKSLDRSILYRRRRSHIEYYLTPGSESVSSFSSYRKNMMLPRKIASQEKEKDATRY